MNTTQYKFSLINTKRRLSFNGFIQGTPKTSPGVIDHKFTEWTLTSVYACNCPFTAELETFKDVSAGGLIKKIRLFANRERLTFKRL